MPQHVVVDGSNIATEGRTLPSLKQLNEAVLAFMDEHPDSLITVVVDATFGHRIDSKESVEFDDAVANNELVAPPAGAIGRGDAFVLSIANKAKATILSNDSFQEFHGQYDWLFDEGRLIGGKPVPHVGWVFVNRLPVRGPLSRKVMSEAKRKRGAKAGDETVRVGSPESSRPMPVPKAPPPGPARVVKERGQRAPVVDKAPARDAAPAPRSTVNELLTFLTFVGVHPVGTSVNALVDHYSSHGAYVRIGEVMGYVPLRLMADPAPRSAREFMKVGESVTLVVDSFVPAKRSIDLAIPGVGNAVAAVAPAKRGGTRKKAAAAPQVVEPLVVTPAATRAAPKKAAATKKVAAPVKKVAAPVKKVAAPVKKVAAPVTKAAPVQKVAAPVKKVAAPVKKVAAAPRRARTAK